MMWDAIINMPAAIAAALEQVFSQPNAEDWISFGGWLVALLTLVLAFVSFNLQKARERRIELQENYLRLELESNQVFRFEAEHGHVLQVYKDSQKPDDYGAQWAHAPGDDAAAKRAKDEARVKTESIADNFYLQQLNLFEIAARFRRDNVFAPHIFGSWVIWYHDVTRSWWFREKWNSEYSDNYTADLYYIFTPMSALFEEIAAKAEIPVDDNEQLAQILKHAFFEHVSALFHCPIVLEWLKRQENGSKARAHRGFELFALGLTSPGWKFSSWVKSWFRSPLSHGFEAQKLLKKAGVGLRSASVSTPATSPTAKSSNPSAPMESAGPAISHSASSANAAP